ncbi:MAG: TrmH family RNA methyltransferase [Nitrosopumilaceae archaeon]|jgi:tRNA(Leu) C34 or U34 (ribose-2'-O)-methylase TrmL
MRVVLYNVGRNLNRAYRTCFSFGIEKLILVNSQDISIKWELKGNLFEAKNKVKIIETNMMPLIDMHTIALENYYKQSIYNITWNNLDTILIGGETKGLPKLISCQKATIPTINNFCLTVEASLAIALSEWRRNVNTV